MSKEKQPEDYIVDILKKEYKKKWKSIYNKSDLLKYLNLKSNAIHGNTKSRRSLANWYAIYAILTFYLKQGFKDKKADYSNFSGFNYTDLYAFMRKQYGGSKLQNHALNNRVNTEIADKITHDVNKPLIINNNGKYLIHPDYIYIDGIDITPVIVKIIEEYKRILYKKDHEFETELNQLLSETDLNKQINDIKKLLNEDAEARVFEILSYCILKTHYSGQKIFIGRNPKNLKEEYLKLYKTGRTNANDGGIDFVMRPLGKFFQVTEVGNYDKYFLDIDKINKYPLTFVVKTSQPTSKVKKDLIDYGVKKSGGLKVLKTKYYKAVEDVITINELSKWISKMKKNDIKHMIKEIEHYYKFEMNLL